MAMNRGCQPLIFLPFALAFGICSACGGLSPPREQRIGAYGRFEFRAAEDPSKGFVIGVPRGGSEPGAVEYAQSMRDRLAAALVVAYDSDTPRTSAAAPLTHTSPIAWSAANGLNRGGDYAKFRGLLRSTVGGPIEFYVGLRALHGAPSAQRIEVASAGMTFEQLQILKSAYTRTRDRLIANRELPHVEIALDPLDEISWNSHEAKNHGVLMLARRGLIMRLPGVLAQDSVRAVYQKILNAWVSEARKLSLDDKAPGQLIDLTPLPLGRIDSIVGRGERQGIVIGAPHGSFDWYTAELVEELSYRTELPAVIARGFTPIECGGWRINVNRPSELRYPANTIERKTERASEIYQRYRAAVVNAAGGSLDLYIDIHQNSEVDNIDVATLGVSRIEAQALKTSYREIRDRVLLDFPDVAKANFAIEPIDPIAIGAWAAKDHGILRQAKRSLHFEMPSHRVFSGKETRRAYRRILAELIRQIANSP